VILFTAVGLGAAHLFSYESATPIGIVAGLLIAPLIPAKTACSIRPPGEAGPE
jgi:hypothetical protein